MKLLNLLVLFVISGICFETQASFALRGKSFSSTDKDSARQPLEINEEFLARHELGREVGIDKRDVAAVVPRSLRRTTNDGNWVRDQIIMKSASSIANSDLIKNSALFKTAKKVEKSTKVEMKIKPKKTVTNANPVEHKFDVNVEAFKKEARFIYKGYVDSKIEYKHEDDFFRVSVKEDLSKNSYIAVTHQKNRYGKIQMLKYFVSW